MELDVFFDCTTVLVEPFAVLLDIVPVFAEFVSVLCDFPIFHRVNPVSNIHILIDNIVIPLLLLDPGVLSECTSFPLLLPISTLLASIISSNVSSLLTISSDKFQHSLISYQNNWL